jgi:hypothetical protein
MAYNDNAVRNNIREAGFSRENPSPEAGQVPGPREPRAEKSPEDLENSLGCSYSNAEEETLQQMGDEFIGRVIQEYERAVRRGLLPNKAIASVLEWASCECQRLLP